MNKSIKTVLAACLLTGVASVTAAPIVSHASGTSEPRTTTGGATVTAKGGVVGVGVHDGAGTGEGKAAAVRSTTAMGSKGNSVTRTSTRNGSVSAVQGSGTGSASRESTFKVTGAAAAPVEAAKPAAAVSVEAAKPVEAAAPVEAAKSAPVEAAAAPKP